MACDFRLQRGTLTATLTFDEPNRRTIMRRIATVFAVAALAAGAAACGHTIEQKAATGAVAGAVVAGPVGAAVGGAAGAAVGHAERPK
jgi:osmotically inducible lipoprotein OsmB